MLYENPCINLLIRVSLAKFRNNQVVHNGRYHLRKSAHIKQQHDKGVI